MNVNARNDAASGSAARVESISRVYLLLGKVFSHPHNGLYEAAKSGQLQEDLRILVEGLPFFDVSFNRTPPPASPQDELESEYINTFDLGQDVPCPLYEHEHRKGEMARLDIVEELLRYYEHFDVKLGASEKDYPDHLVVELEFMAFLAMKEADAVKRGNDRAPYHHAQTDFLERHLTKWVHKLDERIQKRTREPFYKWAGAFAAAFLREHLLYLAGQVQKITTFLHPGPLPHAGEGGRPPAGPRAGRPGEGQSVKEDTEP